MLPRKRTLAIWTLLCQLTNVPMARDSFRREPMTMYKVWVGAVLICCTVFGTSARCAASLAPLDELTAPVALYPDALLAQVLTCATSPGQVTEMYAWLQQISGV
jgi:Protein of unknown function (DUF3300)